MASTPSVYVLGCGGHAKVVVQTLRALGYDIAGVFDDNDRKWGQSLLGLPVSGPIQRIADLPGVSAIIAVGDNSIRQTVASHYDSLNWLTIVHPQAYVDPTAELGAGTVVFAGAIVQASARIGSHVIINTAASVDHDCTLGDWVHIAPGARLAGGVQVAERACVGIGAVILPEKQIGARSIIGAGAVVIRDMPADITAVGNPARILQGARRTGTANGRHTTEESGTE
ncbi:MAG: acetyltransferase [Pirellulaceae bacterium]